VPSIRAASPRRRPTGCSRARGAGLRAAAAVLATLTALASTAAAIDEGQPAPAFRAPALDGGGTVSLAAHRGKVVYLDFWASWCAPCLTSLPLLEELRKEFSPRDFQVVAVNVDRDLEKARRFLERRPIGYPSASDPEGRLPGRFGVETMPTSFLIDRHGLVRHVHPGFRKSDLDGLRATIAELVKEKG
jgi:peroxiredoxin